MIMKIELQFPGGVRVDATFRGTTVHTDQPAPVGGGSAPAPFDLFLASIATCMGYYAMRFCQERDIPIEGLGLTVETVKDPELKLITEMNASLTLPPGFPEKYRPAILRAIETCSVKKHLMQPPRIGVEIVESVAV